MTVTVNGKASISDNRTSSCVQYTARRSGEVALRALSTEQTATVMGVTSRGVFIRTASKWVIFLSYEDYCSPLTVALGERPHMLQGLRPAAPMLTAKGSLIFPTADSHIVVPRDAVWHCPRAIGPVQPVAGRVRWLQHVGQIVVVAAQEYGLSPLLPALLDLPGNQTVPASLEATLHTILQLQHSLRTESVAAAVEHARRLLGKGEGLTPSGDDFMVGFLLVLNRWPRLYTFRSILYQFGEQIIKAAYDYTTTLSANLLECSIRGESDERLIRVADQLVTGRPGTPQYVVELLRWGASSGTAAFAGMAAALACQASLSLR
ncbi:MAG TPA: hypothetical protein DEP84_20450 [Chloroflexi bacterium]|nr:hypothetical protein [Chloroflexota bacterium]